MTAASPTAPHARVEELEARRRELAKLVVHDLRNPIAAIIGHLDLLRLELGEVAPHAGALLDDLTGLAHKALGMVGMLLDVEELEEGVLRAEPCRVALVEFLGALIKPYRATCAGRSIGLSTEIAELEVLLDPDLVGRVVENLLDNAVRYAARRGRVALHAGLVDGVLEVRIGNDGPPVPADDRAQIFERYFRIEARRAAARESRGLGLFFCKLVAAAHGGSIDVVESAALPCEFVLRLPQGG